ncbi:MAG: CPBP family intramembrane metalloprotease [Candidatus Micrarchaeota archaeon]|nr:CPBP family intramembrane metalloprotease [Candidatus Micrarchaeota archaeon]
MANAVIMRKSRVNKSILALLAAACIVVVAAALSYFTGVGGYYIAAALTVPTAMLLRKDADAFLLVLFTALLAICMSTIGYFTPMLFSLVMLLTPLYFHMRSGCTFPEALSALGLKGTPVRAFIFAVLSMIPAILLIFLLSQAAYYFGFNDSKNVDRKITELPLYVLLYAVTIGPIAEEVFFRSFLTKHMGPLLANVLFAFAHFSYGSVYEIIGAFGLGIFLYALFRVSGDLKAPIFAHIFINAGSLYIIRFMQV